jgi:hypothetical protein
MLSEPGNWVDIRLAAAIKAATTSDHVFPGEVAAEFRKFLAGPLQEARKPAELDEIATLLISANRGGR